VTPGSGVRTLHIVIPTFDEGATLESCLRRVVAAPLPEGWSRRLYIVDDHSKPPHDAAVRDVVERMRSETHDITLIRHAYNRGKGRSVRTGFDAVLDESCVDDDVVIIQDADLEYDPGDYAGLMQPLIDGDVEVVIGTRWGSHYRATGLKRRIHALGNGALTGLSNMMTGYRVSDMECCYKLLTVGVLRRVQPFLTENRFGIEPQIVATLSALRIPLVERPVRYDPRGISEGKKIGWRDGIRAIHVIFREKLRKHDAPEPQGR